MTGVHKGNVTRVELPREAIEQLQVDGLLIARPVVTGNWGEPTETYELTDKGKRTLTCLTLIDIMTRRDK